VGVHAVVIAGDPLTTADVFQAAINVKPEGRSKCFVRVRSRANFSNFFGAIIDFPTQSAIPEYEHPIKLAVPRVYLRPLKEGWVEITMQGILVPDRSVPEIEIATMSDDGLLKLRGTPEKGLLIRRPLFQASSWPLIENANQTEFELQRSKLNDLRKTKTEEEKRHTQRLSYIQSPEYRRIANMRGIHKGKRAFIIGNGPSINSQDLTILKDEITFVTNWFVHHPDYLEIAPKYMCVSSHEMFGGWKRETPRLNDQWLEKMREVGPSTRKIFSYKFAPYVRDSEIFSADEVDFLLFDRPKQQVDESQDIQLDLSRHMLDGYTGVITFCLPLAYHFGINEIYLVGCDCDYGISAPNDERKYFYDRSLHTSSETKSTSLLRVWDENGPGFKAYETVKTRFDAEGIPIVNLTDGGRLNVFPRLDYQAAAKILGLGQT
jgi:hypothetical protein